MPGCSILSFYDVCSPHSGKGFLITTGTVMLDADGSRRSDLMLSLTLLRCAMSNVVRAHAHFRRAVPPYRLHNATSTASPDVITDVAPHIHLLPSSGRQDGSSGPERAARTKLALLTSS